MSFNIKIECNNKTNFFVKKDNINDLYFNEVRRFPLLEQEEERKLLIATKNAPTEKERKKAKDKLAESNLRFVISVAKKLGTPETFNDLVSEGNMGLIKAIEKYDVENNDCKLITYAFPWIVAFIKNYQITQQNAVVPPNAHKLHSYIKKVTNDFILKNERKPTSYEIAEIIMAKYKFNISNLEDVELSKVISIDEKINFDEDETLEVSNVYIQHTKSNNVEDEIDKEHKTEYIKFILSKLNDRERFIVERRCGIGHDQETFETIAMNLGLGCERVRQLYKEAINKLKKQKNNLKNF